MNMKVSVRLMTIAALIAAAISFYNSKNAGSVDIEFLVSDNTIGEEIDWLSREEGQVTALVQSFCAENECNFENLAVRKNTKAVPGQSCTFDSINLDQVYYPGFEWPASEEHANWGVRCLFEALKKASIQL